jgi:lipopolysaccharide/colanic/teichoic acid biosynthesis glycosyltransferase
VAAVPRRAYDPVKRVIDVVLALVALVLTAPLQLMIALMVRRRLGSPVLFRQERPGKDAELFEVVKFRTMLPGDPARGTADDAERVTPFGEWLRSTSLDELPSLWNVLKGDMSLVGPRPLLTCYLPRYSPWQARRHEVRPGLTGLAAIAGRNSVDWPRRLALDVEYVERRSLRLDLSIMLATVGVVLRRHGVTPGGVEPDFMGETLPDDPSRRPLAG